MDAFIFLFFSYKDCRVRPRLVKAIPTVLKKVFLWRNVSLNRRDEEDNFETAYQSTDMSSSLLICFKERPLAILRVGHGPPSTSMDPTKG